MGRAKKWIIWVIAMVMAVFIANLIGTFLTKKYAEILIPAYNGYSRKMVLPLQSDGSEEAEKKNQGIIMVRSTLSDTVIQNNNNVILSSLVFADFHVDQSIVFFGPEGMNELSEGIFAPVYTDNGQYVYIKNIIGVINVKDLYGLDCGKQLMKELEKNREATVRLDSYAIDNYIIEPAEISLLDSSGDVIAAIDCPCSGETVKGENVVILNRYKDENDLDSLYIKLRTASLGERSSDIKAKKLAAEIDLDNGDYELSKQSYGFAKYTQQYSEVEDGRGEVLILEYSYLRGVIVYSVIFGILFSVLILVIFRKKGSDKDIY